MSEVLVSENRIVLMRHEAPSFSKNDLGVSEPDFSGNLEIRSHRTLSEDS